MCPSLCPSSHLIFILAVIANTSMIKGTRIAWPTTGFPLPPHKILVDFDLHIFLWIFRHLVKDLLTWGPFLDTICLSYLAIGFSFFHNISCNLWNAIIAHIRNLQSHIFTLISLWFNHITLHYQLLKGRRGSMYDLYTHFLQALPTLYIHSFVY